MRARVFKIILARAGDVFARGVGFLQSRRALRLGLACMLIGLLISALSAETWVRGAGVLVAGIGVAIPAASIVGARVSEPTARRLALTLISCLVVAPPVVMVGLWQPPTQVELTEIEPMPGAAIVLSGVDSRPPSRAGGSASSPLRPSGASN